MTEQPRALAEDEYDGRDIVEVLRNCREGVWTPVLDKAADTIERLRAEVATLRTANAIWEQTEMRPK
jgi:hypothetical protein